MFGICIATKPSDSKKPTNASKPSRRFAEKFLDRNWRCSMNSIGDHVTWVGFCLFVGVVFWYLFFWCLGLK